ncbi:MAG: preprotein translocase subunit YajC [Candidatus Sumerlaeia bacterium]|nr:preprotein translocase subunit YajC [Candidatus Sumerlaeia bacterium]
MFFSTLILLTAQAKNQSAQSNFLPTLLLIGSLMFLFYVLILRPQKRQEQERQKMLKSLEKGDKVVTIGGIYGLIVDIDEQAKIVTLEVAKNVKIDFMLSAISQVVKKKKQATTEKAEEQSKQS